MTRRSESSWFRGLIALWNWMFNWPEHNPGRPSVAIDYDEPGGDATPPLERHHHRHDANFATAKNHPHHLKS